MRSRILGTGAYVPDRILTNADLEKMVDTSDSWIIERTGIRERRIVGEDEACSDLAMKAAENALAKAGISPSQLDLIIVGTCTGDSPLPSTACLVQQKIGATRAAAFDLNAACCGFVYSLALADAYVKTGLQYVLVIGAEVMSSITDWTDRNTCVLFGDGAGAVVVGKAEGDDGILSIHLHGDGEHSELIQVPGGGSRFPASEQTLNDKLQFVQMKGNETFKVAVKTMEEAVREVLTFNSYSIEHVDVFVPHQANIRIIQSTAKKLGVGMERVIVTVQDHGNTSAASIPLALSVGVERGQIKQGDLVVLKTDPRRFLITDFVFKSFLLVDQTADLHPGFLYRIARRCSVTFQKRNLLLLFFDGRFHLMMFGGEIVGRFLQVGRLRFHGFQLLQLNLALFQIGGKLVGSVRQTFQQACSLQNGRVNFFAGFLLVLQFQNTG